MVCSSRINAAVKQAEEKHPFPAFYRREDADSRERQSECKWSEKKSSYGFAYGVSCAVASRVGVSVVGSSTSTPTRVIGVLIELLLEDKGVVGGWERVSLSFRIET